MKQKNPKFQMRMKRAELRALSLLAYREGISMSEYLKRHIRLQASHRGIRT